MKKISKYIIILFFIICLILILIYLKNTNINKLQNTVPYLLDIKCEIIEENQQQGMTIKDSYGNEWVWIMVPKEVFLTAKSKDDYDNIEHDIREYTKEYYVDDYEDYIDNVEYNTLKQKTLSSIYEYGGFWISRYEIGTDQIRQNKEDKITEPFSKCNLYVYNYVTFNQAKELASQISNSSYTSSLLFGFQWDLVCKFIEKNGYTKDNEKITMQMINVNSNSWGNYYSSNFYIDRGKYSEDYGKNYYEIAEPYEKKEYKNLLLTTGASEQNKVCNIYDFAGNVSEWTLEYTKGNKNWNIIRDGSFYFNYGGNDPVTGRYRIDTNSSGTSYGFRVMCIR